jgi:hypothetical protein
VVETTRGRQSTLVPLLLLTHRELRLWRLTNPDGGVQFGVTVGLDYGGFYDEETQARAVFAAQAKLSDEQVAALSEIAKEDGDITEGKHMTASSSWITFDDGARAPGTYAPAGTRPTVKLPDAKRGSIWMIRDWAAQRAIEIEYVDGGWLYVSVGRQQLQELLGMLFDDDAEAVASGMTDVDTVFGAGALGPFFVDAEEF